MHKVLPNTFFRLPLKLQTAGVFVQSLCLRELVTRQELLLPAAPSVTDSNMPMHSSSSSSGRRGQSVAALRSQVGGQHLSRSKGICQKDFSTSRCSYAHPNTDLFYVRKSRTFVRGKRKRNITHRPFEVPLYQLFHASRATHPAVVATFAAAC